MYGAGMKMLCCVLDGVRGDCEATHFIGEERKEEAQTFVTDGDRGHVSEQMKLMSFRGSFKARLKSRDGSLFLLFSSFTALHRGLGATRLRSGLVWLM